VETLRVTHLGRKISSHRLNRVGGDLSTVPATPGTTLVHRVFRRCRLASHAGKFEAKDSQLVHHCVDGPLSWRISRGSHGKLRERSPLATRGRHSASCEPDGQVLAIESPNRVQVPSRASHPVPMSLPSKLASVRPRGKPGDLGRKDAELLNHGINDWQSAGNRLQGVFRHVQTYRLRQISLRHCCNRASNIPSWVSADPDPAYWTEGFHLAQDPRDHLLHAQPPPVRRGFSLFTNGRPTRLVSPAIAHSLHNNVVNVSAIDLPGQSTPP